MKLLRRRDLVCQQAVELVTDYLEGSLSRSARRRFEAHLADCPHQSDDRWAGQLVALLALARMGARPDRDVIPVFENVRCRW